MAEVIARCENDHPLTEAQVATGKCPECGVDLFPGKGPADEPDTPPPGDWEGTDDAEEEE